MKKLILMLGLLQMSLSSCGRDFSYTYGGQTLEYTVIDEGAGTVMVKPGRADDDRDFDDYTGGNEIYGDLIIPAVVVKKGKEYSVTAIGDLALYRSSDMTSVTIPATVTTIGEQAFFECFDLVSVTIPHSVTTIDHLAFYGCVALKSLTIPDSVKKIGELAFCECNSLTSVTIPDSVDSIGTGAFAECENLNNLILPSHLIKDSRRITSVVYDD